MSLVIDLPDDAKLAQEDAAKQQAILIVARTLYGEARDQSEEGIKAVANVMANRLAEQTIYNEKGKSGYHWGNTLAEVAQKSSVRKIRDEEGQPVLDEAGNPTFVRTYQYDCWRPGTPNYDAMMGVSEETLENGGFIAIATAAYEGTLLDNTFGADHFYNPDTATPQWRNHGYETTTIGNHHFRHLASVSSGRLWEGMPLLAENAPIPEPRPSFREDSPAEESSPLIVLANGGETARDMLKKYFSGTDEKAATLPESALAYVNDVPRVEGVSYNNSGLLVLPEPDELATRKKTEEVAPVPHERINRETVVAAADTAAIAETEFAQNSIEITFHRGDTVGKLALAHGVASKDLSEFYKAFENANNISDAGRVLADHAYKMPLVLGFKDAEETIETKGTNVTDQPAVQDENYIIVPTHVVRTISIHSADQLTTPKPESDTATRETTTPTPATIDQSVAEEPGFFSKAYNVAESIGEGVGDALVAVPGVVKNIFDVIGWGKDDGIIIVKSGDTLSDLVKGKFPELEGRSLANEVDAVAAHNHLRSKNFIREGQTLDLTR